MEEAVTVTKADLKAIFERWNKEATENGWFENPLDPDKQAEQFFEYAKDQTEN